MATQNSKTHILTESAIMVALATVLSMFKIWEAPYGGSVTVLSMAPIIVLSMRRGVKVGLFAGFVHSLIQLLLGLNNVAWVPTASGIVICILTDYILPFTLLGLGGCFRNVKFTKNENTNLLIAAALGLNYVFGKLGRFENPVQEGETISMLPEETETLAENADTDTDEAARAAVEAVRRGQADVLMKGMLNTDNLLRAVLNKEHGILPQGNVLTHITAAEIPGRDRLLFFTDAAVIPSPTLPQRVAMVEDIAGVCRAFGIDCPRIALIHCTEKTSPKFPLTLDYGQLKEMAAEGRFGHIIIDGPMDVKVACDPHAGALKGIVSPVDGRADALIMPDIESGNVFYKTLTGFVGALTAGMLVGTSAPVVLPSRGDSTRAKLCSLAMACLTATDR